MMETLKYYQNNIYVIGSGPAGVSCAAALLERGYCVTMLDAGLELENDKRTALEKLKISWDEKTINEFKHSQNSGNSIKLSYNSDYPYAEVSKYISMQTDKHIHCSPSFAKGGLSNVWGGVVETYNENTITDWPINVKILDPYYKKILGYLSPACALNNGDGSNYYQLSRQAEKLLMHMKNNIMQLNNNGFQFGTPQLAVKFSSNIQYKCVYCGNCLHGCPLQLIYSSSNTLAELLKNNKFTYLKDRIVENFKETDTKISIYVYNRVGNSKEVFIGTQVFCACGPIISTMLALKSKSHFNQKIEFTDSTHFILPCIMRHRVKNVMQEKLHTLCQLYIKLDNSTISSRPINLQIYSYMDFYTEKFKQILKGSSKLVLPFLNPIIDRLIVIQGHLDSRESHKFNMQLNNNGQTIQLESILNPEVNIIFKRLITHLKQNSKNLGFIPIQSMLKISKISTSFHYGGSMPMSSSQKEFVTDIWGRPFGFKRLHVVDSSIFPSIPAGSITPSIMANAYRIGSECEIH